MKALLHIFKGKWQEAGFQRYLKNVGWMFASRAAVMAISFLTTLYIARRLGPTNFGELDYAIAIVALFAWIGSWGIDSVLNRELIKHPEQRNELTGTAMLLRAGFGLLATLLTIVFALVSPIDSVSQTLILLLSLTSILSIPQTLQNDFLARAESKYPSLVTVLVTLLTSIAKVIVIATGQGVIYLAVAMLFEQVLYGVLYVALYVWKGHGQITAWRYSPLVAKLTLKTGTAVAFLVLFSIVYARIDQVMIRHFLGAHEVGLYSAGIRLVEVWGFIPAVILGGLYPAVLNAKKVSETFYYFRLQKMLLLLTGLGLIITLFLVITGPFIMHFIYGPSFAEGTLSLQVYALSLPAAFIGYFVMQVLYTDDYRKILITVAAVPAIVNVILNLFFIPTYGIVGAAWATVISYIMAPLVPLAFRQTRTVLLRTIFPQPEVEK